MSVENHLIRLKEKHFELEESIWEEYRQAFPDELKIKTLKTLKLRLKEELNRLLQ
ncbi:MAG: YdcH family protein [Candidatus Nucleicultricaceae bacterium]